MKDFKKIYGFLVLLVWLFATIGSAAYLFYFKEYHFGITNLLLSAMAFPYVKEVFTNSLKG